MLTPPRPVAINFLFVHESRYKVGSVKYFTLPSIKPPAPLPLHFLSGLVSSAFLLFKTRFLFHVFPNKRSARGGRWRKWKDVVLIWRLKCPHNHESQTQFALIKPKNLVAVVGTDASDWVVSSFRRDWNGIGVGEFGRGKEFKLQGMENVQVQSLIKHSKFPSIKS